MLGWFRSDGRRTAVRQDRKYIVARARRFLLSYLASDETHKHRYLELVAGAAAACQPQTFDPDLENTELSKVVAEAALRVVKVRDWQAANSDQLATSITDAYATVAMAYRRAAAIYVLDEEMQQIGTAAVHLVTIANSYKAAQSPETAVAVQEARGPAGTRLGERLALVSVQVPET
jgi:hypothetical protein